MPAREDPITSGKGTGFDHIPVIDISPLFDGDPARKAAVAKELGAACEEVGFFYIKNHGIDEALIQRLEAQADAFFHLPDDVKNHYHIGKSANHRGYVPRGEEGFEEPGKAPDFKEAFDLALDLPAEDPDYLAGNPLLGPNVWPDETPAFREEVGAYYRAALELGRVLFRGFALAIGLPEDHFDQFVSKPTSQLRLVHYPANDGPSDEKHWGISAHTDYECFTILHPTAPGLQVMNADGDWIDAPPLPGTFVINIGDMMEAWTNGRFIATSHRVLNTAGERFSFPLFFAVNFDTLVRPLDICTSQENPPRYPPIKAGEHLFAQTARTFRYLRDRLEAGELTLAEEVPFGRDKRDKA